MQEFTKTVGVIIKTHRYGEGDLLITAICKDLGTVTVMCRGGASSRCKYGFCLQPLCYDEFVLYKTKTGGYILKEAAIERQFFEISENQDGYDIGCYLCELASVLCAEGNYDEDILRLLLNSLHLMGQGNYSALHIKAVFEMRAMALSGYMPETEVCIKCGKTVFEKSSSAYFDLIEGGTVCTECEEKHRELLRNLPSFEKRTDNTIEITCSVGAALRYIISSPAEKVFGFSVTEEERPILYDVCEQYVINQLETEFVTLDQYYKKLEFQKRTERLAKNSAKQKE